MSGSNLVWTQMSDLKSNKCTAQVGFEIANMISNQNLNNTKFNHHFITCVLKLQNSVA